VSPVSYLVARCPSVGPSALHSLSLVFPDPFPSLCALLFLEAITPRVRFFCPAPICNLSFISDFFSRLCDKIGPPLFFFPSHSFNPAGTAPPPPFNSTSLPSLLPVGGFSCSPPCGFYTLLFFPFLRVLGPWYKLVTAPQLEYCRPFPLSPLASFPLSFMSKPFLAFYFLCRSPGGPSPAVWGSSYWNGHPPPPPSPFSARCLWPSGTFAPSMHRFRGPRLCGAAGPFEDSQRFFILFPPSNPFPVTLDRAPPPTSSFSRVPSLFRLQSGFFVGATEDFSSHPSPKKPSCNTNRVAFSAPSFHRWDSSNLSPPPFHPLVFPLQRCVFPGPATFPFSAREFFSPPLAPLVRRVSTLPPRSLSPSRFTFGTTLSGVEETNMELPFPLDNSTPHFFPDTLSHSFLLGEKLLPDLIFFFFSPFALRTLAHN